MTGEILMQSSPRVFNEHEKLLKERGKQGGADGEGAFKRIRLRPASWADRPERLGFGNTVRRRRKKIVERRLSRLRAEKKQQKER